MQLRIAGFLNRLPLRALALSVVTSTCLASSLVLCGAAQAGPSVIIDVSSGKVLQQDQATRPWYPASLTKLMTVYVALTAVKDGRVTMDTPFIMSPRAARMAPSKMGFAPGTAVTLDNALKMLMVKSANDIAVMIAEGVSGSVEDFAAEMNSTAAKLGLRESHFVNPNGLPDPEHVSSARDMALIGRALYVDFPDYAGLFDIGALRMTSGQIIPTHNGLLGRYPGADGMKTGFICASGFNVVASATHGGQQLIAVVMGSSSAKSRTIKVATLLDAAFAGRFPAGPTINQLPKSAENTPADIHAQVCGRHRVAQEDDFAVPMASGTAGAAAGTGDPGGARDYVSQQTKGGVVTLVPTQIVMNGRPAFEPIDVFVGPRPGYTGNVAKARDMPGPMDATAYAAAAKAQAAEAPLAPDPTAVSMKLAKGRQAHGKKARVATAKAKPEKLDPVKVVSPMPASAGDASLDNKPTAKPVPRPSDKAHIGHSTSAKDTKQGAGKSTAGKPANHAEANLREKLPPMAANKIPAPTPKPAIKVAPKPAAKPTAAPAANDAE